MKWTRFLEAAEHPADDVVGCQINPSQQIDIVKGGTIALHRRNRQLQLPMQIQEELRYLLNSSLAWREIPSRTPMEEPRPLFLVERCCGTRDPKQQPPQPLPKSQPFGRDA